MDFTNGIVIFIIIDDLLFFSDDLSEKLPLNDFITMSMVQGDLQVMQGCIQKLRIIYSYFYTNIRCRESVPGCKQHGDVDAVNVFLSEARHLGNTVQQL